MKKLNRNDVCVCGSGKKYKKCCGLKSKERLFWDWFSEKSDEYFSFENDQDRLFEELTTELHELDENLGFEFSNILENGKREFIISACGIKSSFPAVSNLVINSPSLPKWTIIAFKQPHLDCCTTIIVHDLEIDITDVFFLFTKSNGLFDIELHMRGYEETEEWVDGAFLLLDQAIGEYATEMKIGEIIFKKLKESNIPNLYPITELPKIIGIS
jgi:hypothetical protein